MEEERRKLRAMVKMQEAECAQLQKESASIRKRLWEGKVTAPKEMEAMEKRADSLDARQENLETQVIENMMELDEMSTSIGATGSAVEAAEKSLEDRIDKVRARRAEIDSEVADLASRRAPEWEGVPDNLKAEYEYRRSRKQGQVVSAVRSGHCSVCRMRISIVLANKIERGDGLYSCENCGRLLCWNDDGDSS